MKSSKFAIVAALLPVATVLAENEEGFVQEEAVEKTWTIRAGYAWRSRAKTDFAAQSSQTPGGTYRNGTFAGALGGSQDWTFGGQFDEGRYTDVNYGGTPLYSMALERTESVGGGSGEDSASGVNIAAGYDLWQNEYVAVSALARFAGYWNIGNGAWGGYRQYFDHYSFPFPTPGMGYGTPVEGVDTAEWRERTYGFGGANPMMRFKADLYQFGLGPQVTWHAFHGWCDTLDWIDVYGGVEILCNIIHSDFTAGAASSSDTDCRIGFGGNVGLVGNVTDWFGIYGQIGYEWIDKSDVSAMGCTAETDYSSLVLMAGVQFRF